MRINLFLTNPELTALLKLSESEMRLPKDQIRLIVRNELERRGMLEKDEPKNPEKQAAGVVTS